MSKQARIKTTGTRLVIKPINEENKIGSIVLPEKSMEKAFKGQIVGLNEYSTFPNGDITAPKYSLGDIVVHSKGAGTEIEVEGEKYKVIHEDEIVCAIG